MFVKKIVSLVKLGKLKGIFQKKKINPNGTPITRGLPYH